MLEYQNINPIDWTYSPFSYPMYPNVGVWSDQRTYQKLFTPTAIPDTYKDMQTIALTLTNGHTVQITGDMEALFEIASKLGGQLTFNPPKANQTSSQGIRGPRKSKEEIDAIVADYHASGLNKSQYATQKGYGYQTFNNWVNDREHTDGSKAEGTTSGGSVATGPAKRGKGKKS